MQIIEFEKSKTTQLFWLIVGVIFTVVVLSAKQSEPTIVGAGGLLAIVSLIPFYLWLLGMSHGLPIWPVFALVTGMTYALPALQAASSLNDYSPSQIITGTISTVGFIILGTMVWLSFTSRAPTIPKKIRMIEQKRSVQYLLAFIWIGVFFGLNQMMNWVVFPGNTMQLVRGIAISLNIMGLFVLGYYQGRGILEKGALLLYVLGAIFTILIGMTSLMLAQAFIPMVMAFFGYMLGANKMPLKLLLLLFPVLALLHAGKYQMREQYWGGGMPGVTLLTMPEFFSTWLQAGYDELGGGMGIVSKQEKEGPDRGIFERAGNLHMLLLVQEKSPTYLPYLMGATYSPIPRLLIPRFIDDQKGISHMGNIILSMYYGLQTAEQTQSTSIGWGLLPEAYANFGFLGIAGLAIALALFYSYITNLTVGVPMTSLRFVLGLLILSAAARADTMGIFVTSQFQGIIGISFAALVLMRVQDNPLAVVNRAENVVEPEQDSILSRWGRRSRSAERRRTDELDARQMEVVDPKKKHPRWADASHRKAMETGEAERRKRSVQIAGDSGGKA